MVKTLILVLVLCTSACSMTPQTTARPDLQEPESLIPELEMLEQTDYKSFEYPNQIQSIIKNAQTVVPEVGANGHLIYRKASDADKDQVMLLLTTEEAFLIRDLFVAARENKNLADRLINIQEFSVEERNQLLRVLKTEAYRMKRTKAFTDYYKAELERVETANTIESWSLKILTALALII